MLLVSVRQISGAAFMDARATRAADSGGMQVKDSLNKQAQSYVV